MWARFRVGVAIHAVARGVGAKARTWIPGGQKCRRGWVEYDVLRHPEDTLLHAPAWGGTE